MSKEPEKKELSTNEALHIGGVRVSLFDKNNVEIKKGDKFKTGWTGTIFIVEDIYGVLCIDGTPLKSTIHTWGEVVN